MNNKALFLIVIVFGLFLTALITRQGGPAWMAMPFLAYLGIGILQSPSVSKIRLQATRSVKRIDLGGDSVVQVAVTIRNEGAEILYLDVSDTLPSEARLAEGWLRKPAALRPGEELALQYGFQARRGCSAWQTIRAAVSDPLGLVGTELNLPAAAEVQVPPELKKMRPFPLRPRHTLHMTGSIPARLGGRGTNFWGVREYYPGDPLRRLDWRRTARHPNQFFTKEFEQEEIADVGLILDARQMTDLQAGEESLFEHSIRAIASLAEAFLRQGNRVSLLIYGKQPVSLFPGYGKTQLNRILRALSQAVPEAEIGFNPLQFIPLNLFSSQSLLVVLSPLAPGDWQLFPRLRAHGYQVLLISPDPVDFAQRTLPADPATRLAARLTRVERRLQIGRITQLWVPVIDWQVGQPLAPLVRTALRTAHIQMER